MHYTSVIYASAKSAGKSSSAPRSAEEVLRSMLHLYNGGACHLAPDTVVFSVTIDAYAESKRGDVALRVLAILKLMDDFDVEPDIITYNTVLNTLGNSHTDYLSTAKNILYSIEESTKLRADSFTYNAIIKCCLPEDAEKLIQVRHG